MFLNLYTTFLFTQIKLYKAFPITVIIFYGVANLAKLEIILRTADFTDFVTSKLKKNKKLQIFQPEFDLSYF